LSSEYEQRAVESVLKDNGSYFLMGLEPRDFSDPFYRTVYASMSEMLSKGLNVDLLSLQAHNPNLSASRLASLDPVTSANAEFFANELKSKTRRREAILLFKEGLRRVQEERDVLEVIDSVNAELLKISEHRDVALQKAGDMLMRSMERIERIHNNGGEDLGISTGYSDFDQLTGGFRPGELIILAARTSIGKTTLALNIAERMAADGRAVAFFSAEMSEDEVMDRLISSAGRIKHAELRQGNYKPSIFAGIQSAAEKIYEMNLWIDTTPNIKFFDLRNKARLLRNRGVEIVFIDYLTLIRHGDHRTPRWERVGELSRELKSLAREIEAPVFVLSQLNRQAEGQKPALAELRQSGEVEENADMIILMHRDREEGDTTLNIAKHRNGPTGVVNLFLVQEQTRFEQRVYRGGKDD